MRILNQGEDKSLNKVLLLLTIDEAIELRDELERLLLQKNINDHGHINDANYAKELTLSLYEQNNISGFQKRIQKLIIEDI